MKTTLGWLGYRKGSNSCGFTGLPGGARYFYGDGSFNGDLQFGYWWSRTLDVSGIPISHFLSSKDGNLTVYSLSKAGVSVR